MKRVLFLLLISAFVLVGCNSKTEYKAGLQDVSNKILENSAEVEGLLNEYSRIWSFSIKSGSAIGVKAMATEMGLDEETIRKHFELNSIGNVPGDFSTNVSSLNSYYRAIGKLGEIEEASEDIKSKISELNKPPSEYEKAFDEILDMYAYSEEYIEMALNPSGSLQSFNEDKKRLSSEILSKYKRIEAIMPSED